MAEKRLDVIIFGATGFTGKYTVYEAVKQLAGLKWGVAGRNREKLQQVLKEFGQKANVDLTETPIIVADIGDADSLKRMAAACRIVVNCCGPYRFYGEPVVKACIEAGTHHVDVSAEPQYMERMQLDYGTAAQEKGVYVVSACGYDAIPVDMGTVFLEREFDGIVNSVETFQEVSNINGAVAHYGTWESVVHFMAHANEMRELRMTLFPARLPNFKPILRSRLPLHRSRIFNDRWAVMFPSSDRSVALRSQRYFYEVEKKRPIQIKTYFTFSSFLQVMGIIFLAAIFRLLCFFEYGRHLLLTYPGFFSAGFLTRDGPTEEDMKQVKFACYLYGKGWDKTEKLSEPTDQYASNKQPDKSIKVKVSGTNPGYGATCVALLLSATTILREADKLPARGGVFAPGAAFAKTTLIEQLCRNGFKFEVLQPVKSK